MLSSKQSFFLLAIYDRYFTQLCQYNLYNKNKIYRFIKMSRILLAASLQQHGA
jgi:hypothetical protein